jgi:DNA-binding NarL/FixJ family response regulator
MQVKNLPARLLIADDHPLAREGIRAMLASEAELEVIGEAQDGSEAVNLCRCLEPDLVLMDVRMPELNGLEATQEIKVECPDAKVLILTIYEDLDYLFKAVKVGAAGYVIKDATKRELVEAVRRALGGQSSLDQDLAMRLLQRLGREDDQGVTPSPGGAKSPEPLRVPLTPRELEVLRLLAHGLTNRQISQELVISAATVKVHIEHLIAKLGVSDRTEAAVRASQAGLLGTLK